MVVDLAHWSIPDADTPTHLRWYPARASQGCCSSHDSSTGSSPSNVCGVIRVVQQGLVVDALPDGDDDPEEVQ